MNNRLLTTSEVAQGNEDHGVQAEKVFTFLALREPVEAGRPKETGSRNWAAAIDLVKEAAEVVRLAEKKATDAENYSIQLAAHYREQIKAAESRIAAAERRADLAVKRAVEAEEWLVKFHDTILEGFGEYVAEGASPEERNA